jgi:hypothetical protein
MTIARLRLATCSVLIAGCGNGTSLLVVVDPGPIPGAEQLQVEGRADGELVFGPAVRPEHADGPLDGEQTLRVLLADELAGRTVHLEVFALVEGEVRGAGAADGVPRKGTEVRVIVPLTVLPAPCLDCTEGCCNDGRCVSGSLSDCGAGGSVCISCDPQRADRCTSQGRCACGSGPACEDALGSDRCNDGECRCGTGPACAAGQQCENGLCRCTPASCAGCCDGNTCVSGTVDAACGAEGAACVTCVLPQVCLNFACN